MKIEKNTVVQFHYFLRDVEEDKQIETSRDGDPVAFLCGHGNIIRGLEESLIGQEAGDCLTVEVPPEKAYGLRRDGNEQRVPIKHLAEKKNIRLRPGMIVNIQTEKGVKQATVIKAGKFNVDVDTNHPLAGKALSFDIEIIDIRAAEQVEIDHGHAHGVGGHHH
ncbi:FKBP-type peptidyl-prolyl cis-trans isomerase SlyD [BD1-7 clade bacterium]|uniref:Peptidyl-prolyl cis-trans isomerase n=1 Tax=BD1-7 clade bacterium TaxID=2029982 RepID=A0A5S9P9W9_9GAMM|nr:FKBP-type peptidyl-prolyl cis-trans isomerase SlyD [BD1-7 clade bacterium]